MVLRSKHSCGFDTFFRSHQIEFAKERGFLQPSLMLWLDPCHGNRIYQMKEKVMLHHNIWLLCTFLQPQSFTIFFNQYCSNLLKNPTVRGLMN